MEFGVFLDILIFGTLGSERVKVYKCEVGLIKWYNWRKKLTRAAQTLIIGSTNAVCLSVFMITNQKVSWQGAFQYSELPSKQSNNTFNMNPHIRNASSAPRPLG